MTGFTCNDCGRVYIQERNLDPHMKNSNTSLSTSSCIQYGKSFSRSDNLERHKRTCTGHRTTSAAAPTPVTTVRLRPTTFCASTVSQSVGRCRGAVYCKHEGSEAPLNAVDRCKCFGTSNGEVPPRSLRIQVSNCS